jgi:hypothetical protein
LTSLGYFGPPELSTEKEITLYLKIDLKRISNPENPHFISLFSTALELRYLHHRMCLVVETRLHYLREDL